MRCEDVHLGLLMPFHNIVHFQALLSFSPVHLLKVQTCTFSSEIRIFRQLGLDAMQAGEIPIRRERNPPQPSIFAGCQVWGPMCVLLEICYLTLCETSPSQDVRLRRPGARLCSKRKACLTCGADGEYLTGYSSFRERLILHLQEIRTKKKSPLNWFYITTAVFLHVYFFLFLFFLFLFRKRAEFSLAKIVSTFLPFLLSLYHAFPCNARSARSGIGPEGLPRLQHRCFLHVQQAQNPG